MPPGWRPDLARSARCVGAFVLSSIQSYLVVMGVRPQWFMLLLGLIVVFAALGDRASASGR